MRFARTESAQSLVEFALILPIILLVITGLFDLARAVWQENTLAYAAREGTRYAIVHGSASSLPSGPSPQTDQAVKDAVTKAAVGVSNITVTVAYIDGNNDRNSRVQVDASAPFVPLPSYYLIGSAFQMTLRGGSLLVIQR